MARTMAKVFIMKRNVENKFQRSRWLWTSELGFAKNDERWKKKGSWIWVSHKL